MKMTKKTIIIIVASVVVAIAVIGAIVGVTLAVWEENKHASLYVKTDVEDDNPSIKYSMYVPLASTGKTATQETSQYRKLDGTYSITNGVYSYTLNSESDLENIVAFGFCGWYGGVALDYIEIPDELTMTINGTEVTKPVKRVMSDIDFEDYTLIGNQIIQKLVFGKNVDEIDSGIFFSMTALTTCEFKESASELLVRDYAFANCFKLGTLGYQDTRTLSATTNADLAFRDCGIE